MPMPMPRAQSESMLRKVTGATSGSSEAGTLAGVEPTEPTSLDRATCVSLIEQYTTLIDDKLDVLFPPEFEPEWDPDEGLGDDTAPADEEGQRPPDNTGGRSERTTWRRRDMGRSSGGRGARGGAEASGSDSSGGSGSGGDDVSSEGSDEEGESSDGAGDAADGAWTRTAVEAEVLLRRSTLHAAVGHHDRALRDARSSVDLNKTYAPGYYRLGHALFHSGRSRDASEAFRQVRKRRMITAWAQRQRATCQLRVRLLTNWYIRLCPFTYSYRTPRVHDTCIAAHRVSFSALAAAN